MNAIHQTTSHSVLPQFPVQSLCEWTRDTKYAHDGERTHEEIHMRVLNAVLDGDPRRDEYYPLMLGAMNKFESLPAGRILSGAGTGRHVTWVNCFANQKLEDSMVGILGKPFLNMSVTMQRGGGIGTDFSPIRPKNAFVAGTGTRASGVVSYAKVYVQGGDTVESAGERRGAQMGTLRCDHPDLFNFLEAKATGILKGMNLSILCTDAFMAAVEADGEWELGFPVRPFDPKDIVDIKEVNGKPWYVYARVSARTAWDRIMNATYSYAEPGVIFIDHVQDMNNLAYIEEIITANPCGEQMLPENGACVLGMNWLPMFVRNPFTPEAYFDFKALERSCGYMVRILDNVIDRTPFPWDTQRQEAMNKRRIGIGTPGLGNALAMLGLRYGSFRALLMTARIKKAHRDAAYRASIELAKERGPFPLFDADKHLERPFIKRLPQDIRDGIRTHGIRNGVLLSDAPTGTTGLYALNMSAGIEPAFAFSMQRKITQGDGSLQSHHLFDAGFLLYCKVKGLDPFDPASLQNLPVYMVTTSQLDVEHHVFTQAICQRYVDSSISKTVNVPEDYPFEKFKDVYMLAYKKGCKGCTTYRPNEITGSILSDANKETEPALSPNLGTPATVNTPIITTKLPKKLPSERIEIHWPPTDQTIYLNVSRFTEADGRTRAVEVFVSADDMSASEMSTAVAKLVSHVLRRDCEPMKAIQKLKSIRGADGAWVDGRFYNGLVSLIASQIEEHILSLDSQAGQCGCACASEIVTGGASQQQPIIQGNGSDSAKPSRCPKCGAKAYVHESGCGYCADCGYSKCS